MAGLKTIFGIDLRTLALFRVMLAMMIMVDLLSRAQDLRAHYTDFGVLPRADWISVFNQWQPSLHFAGGSSTVQGLLFLAAGVVAFAMLIGYRTRAATIISWVLLLSLLARNNMISQGGDMLMLMLLFWGMFLPLGARFSVDSALDRHIDNEPNAYFSMATMALLIQCMSVYFFGALLKSDPAWIPEGTAVYSALHLDYLATPFAVWLRQFPNILKGFTYYVWYLELIGPFLMFSPFFHVTARLTVMTLLITMHLGFFLCLAIGLFPFISITSLLAFIPGRIWDVIESRLRTPKRCGLVIYYDEPCEFCRKVCLILRSFLLLPDTPIRTAQGKADIYQDMRRHNSWVVVDHDGSRHLGWQAIALVFRRSPVFRPLGIFFGLPFLRQLGNRIYERVALNRARLGEISAVLLPYRVHDIHPSLGANMGIGALMVFVVYVNLTTLPHFKYRLPTRLDEIIGTLRLRQTWNMFAPAPTPFDGWYVVRGESQDGTPVDVLRHRLGEPDWTRPNYISEEYPTYRWRKYLNRLSYSQYEKHRHYYAEYLCRAWNTDEPEEKKLAQLKLYFNLEEVPPNYEPRKTKRLLLHAHQCMAPIAKHMESRQLDAVD